MLLVILRINTMQWLQRYANKPDAAGCFWMFREKSMIAYKYSVYKM